MNDAQKQLCIQKLKSDLDWWTDEYQQTGDAVCHRMIRIIEDMLTILMADA